MEFRVLGPLEIREGWRAACRPPNRAPGRSEKVGVELSRDGYAWRSQAPVDQGAEMQAFISTEKAFVTYLEGMKLASQNIELGNPGACRRR